VARSTGHIHLATGADGNNFLFRTNFMTLMSDFTIVPSEHIRLVAALRPAGVPIIISHRLEKLIDPSYYDYVMTFQEFEHARGEDMLGSFYGKVDVSGYVYVHVDALPPPGFGYLVGSDKKGYKYGSFSVPTSVADEMWGVPRVTTSPPPSGRCVSLSDSPPFWAYRSSLPFAELVRRLRIPKIISFGFPTMHHDLWALCASNLRDCARSRHDRLYDYGSTPGTISFFDGPVIGINPNVDDSAAMIYPGSVTNPVSDGYDCYGFSLENRRLIFKSGSFFPDLPSIGEIVFIDTRGSRKNKMLLMDAVLSSKSEVYTILGSAPGFGYGAVCRQFPDLRFKFVDPRQTFVDEPNAEVLVRKASVSDVEGYVVSDISFDSEEDDDRSQRNEMNMSMIESGGVAKFSPTSEGIDVDASYLMIAPYSRYAPGVGFECYVVREWTALPPVTIYAPPGSGKTTFITSRPWFLDTDVISKASMRETLEGRKDVINNAKSASPYVITNMHDVRLSDSVFVKIRKGEHIRRIKSRWDLDLQQALKWRKDAVDEWHGKIVDDFKNLVSPEQRPVGKTHRIIISEDAYSEWNASVRPRANGKGCDRYIYSKLIHPAFAYPYPGGLCVLSLSNAVNDRADVIEYANHSSFMTIPFRENYHAILDGTIIRTRYPGKSAYTDHFFDINDPVFTRQPIPQCFLSPFYKKATAPFFNYSSCTNQMVFLKLTDDEKAMVSHQTSDFDIASFVRTVAPIIHRTLRAGVDVTHLARRKAISISPRYFDEISVGVPSTDDEIYYINNGTLIMKSGESVKVNVSGHLIFQFLSNMPVYFWLDRNVRSNVDGNVHRKKSVKYHRSRLAAPLQTSGRLWHRMWDYLIALIAINVIAEEHPSMRFQMLSAQQWDTYVSLIRDIFQA
jgi:hypothetical protein